METQTPKIDHLSWGRIEIDGRSFKDAKVFPGGAREWDWNETGTRHSPGIQPADVVELLEHGAEVIILSRGMWERLQTSEETLSFLEERGVEVRSLPTSAAVDLLNRMRQTRMVGSLLHSTC